jgi:hypothetical protein
MKEKDGTMNKFTNLLLDANSVKQGANNHKNRYWLAASIAVIGLMAFVSAQAQNNDNTPVPTVFQAAGPTVNSIQSSLDGFRAALGGNNNGITAPGGPIIAGGRREINWDGGNAANVTTSLTATPVLDQFLEGRGARFTTPGTGFVQAPPAGLAAADVFDNPSYATIFRAFTLSRLFSAIGSNVTDSLFFQPGTTDVKAVTRGFGVIFTDVDLPDGSDDPAPRQGNRHSSTLVEYFDKDGDVLFSTFAPSSPGDGNFSFVGIVFADARIARVRITLGAIPGVDDTRKRDVVMMDDFIYGEPVAIH